MAFSIPQAFFILIAMLTLFAGVMTVTSRNLVHGALWLVFAFFNVAVIFALLDAGFMAVVQIMLYIGAIATLIIFAMMLTRKVMNDTEVQTNNQWPLSFLVAAAAFVGLAGVVGAHTWAAAPTLAPEAFNLTVTQLGRALVEPNQYVLPFEVSSVLLIVALLGSVAVAREKA